MATTGARSRHAGIDQFNLSQPHISLMDPAAPAATLNVVKCTPVQSTPEALA